MGFKEDAKRRLSGEKMEGSQTYKNIQNREQSPTYRALSAPNKGRKLGKVI